MIDININNVLYTGMNSEKVKKTIMVQYIFKFYNEQSI